MNMPTLVTEGQLEDDYFLIKWGVILEDDDRSSGRSFCYLRDKKNNELHSGCKADLLEIFNGNVTLDAWYDAKLPKVTALLKTPGLKP